MCCDRGTCRGTSCFMVRILMVRCTLCMSRPYGRVQHFKKAVFGRGICQVPLLIVELVSWRWLWVGRWRVGRWCWLGRWRLDTALHILGLVCGERLSCLIGRQAVKSLSSNVFFFNVLCTSYWFLGIWCSNIVHCGTVEFVVIPSGQNYFSWLQITEESNGLVILI